MPEYETFRFDAFDGTSLVGWTNGGEGPPVLICNGLGVPPEAWPRLLDPECGYQVYSWNHRGCQGSDRPADPAAIRVEDHVADALALMRHVGWDRAILVAWSIGVNVSFEIAADYPDKVAGLLMCAGVPGGTFDAAFGSLMVPKPLRRHLGMAVVQAGKLAGPQLNALARLIPVNRATAEVLRHSFMMPYAKNEDVIPWVQAMAEHDFAWYFGLGVAAAEHEPIDPTFVECPITVAAGGFDTMTSMREVVAFADKIEHAEVHVLHGTHMIPLEFPDEIMAMLDGVLLRCDLAAGSQPPQQAVTG